MTNFTATPDWSALPAPTDDGAAKHLIGMRVPSTLLAATDGRSIDLSAQSGRVVVYAYPRTGVPDKPNPDGWDAIPGARGCTPQTCAFRDHYAELKALGVAAVYGLSTQDTAYQREAAERLHLPFALLSDERLALTHAMKLPTFQAGAMVLLKRLTLIIRDGRVEHVFYPVFPPDRNADDVVRWLADASDKSPGPAAGEPRTATDRPGGTVLVIPTRLSARPAVECWSVRRVGFIVRSRLEVVVISWEGPVVSRP
jgi:peroxiredoxin